MNITTSTVELLGQITVLCVIGALLSLLLKSSNSAMALLLTLSIVVTGMLFLVKPVRELLVFFQELGEKSGLPQEYLLPIYKTVGIALIVRTGKNLCHDAGESALATVVETAGAICALLCALPLMRAVLSMLMELLR